MEYGYQGLNSGSKVPYPLNGIRRGQLSTAVSTVRVHPDKYKKDFDAVVTSSPSTSTREDLHVV